MVGIRVQGSEINPSCPLCNKTFEKITNEGETFFVCFSCMVSINTKDIAIHLWTSYTPEDEREIMCINEKCGESMYFFFRSIDGFMKAYCRKCHSSVSTEELPARIDKPRYTAPEGDPRRRPYYDD